MKKEVDYIKEFEEEELALTDLNATPVNEKEREKLELTKRIVELTQSQYELIKNDKKWDLWTNAFYEMMAMNAEIQGGKLTLEIDEESLTGTMTYFGHTLIINNVLCNNLKIFAYMMDAAEDFIINPKGEYMELRFIFHVFDKKQIADHSEEIKKLKSQIYSPEYLAVMLNDK